MASGVVLPPSVIFGGAIFGGVIFGRAVIGMGWDVPEAGVEHQVQQRGRLLKGAVMALSLVLAICAIVITTAIVYRFIKPAPPPALTPFGVSALPVPVGCAIDYVMAEGDRLIIQIGGGDECRRILIGDLRTGSLIGQFQFPNQ
jgi:hypothetical protein